MGTDIPGRSRNCARRELMLQRLPMSWSMRDQPCLREPPGIDMTRHTAMRDTRRSRAASARRPGRTGGVFARIDGVQGAARP